ncbi:MAG TPA: hypothetical protein VHF46_02295, partial [Rubrobacteraceae bacterium]|nr:hypothetical protein [Rubrobacteraceae bacterium]
MQDETQNPGADAAREPNVPDPSVANPVEAEGLNNQDAVAPDSAAASTPTDQGASAFDPTVSDPTVSMSSEDLVNPTSPTAPDPAASADFDDSALRNTGVAGPLEASPPGTVEQAGGEGDMLRTTQGPDPFENLGEDIFGTPPDAPAADPWGMPPPGMVEQEEGRPPVDELEPDDAASASDWGPWSHTPSWTEDVPDSSPVGPSPFEDVSETSISGGIWNPPDWGDDLPDPSAPTGIIMDPVPTDQVEAPDSGADTTPFPEAVSMPHDVIMDP